MYSLNYKAAVFGNLIFSFYLVYGNTKDNISIKNVSDCTIPKERYDPDLEIPHTMKLLRERGKDYIQVNFSIPKKTLPINYSFRGYRVENSVKYFEVPSLSCHNSISKLILKKLKIVYSNNCEGFPGNYTIKLSIHDFSIFITHGIRDRTPHRIEVQLDTARGVAFCMAILLTAMI